MDKLREIKRKNSISSFSGLLGPLPKIQKIRKLYF